MSTTEEIGTANGKLVTLQKKLAHVSYANIESPEFLIGLLPTVAKPFDKRTVSSNLLALATKKDRFKIIESVSVAIEKSERKVAMKIFKRLDHLFQSDVLVPGGAELNRSVYEVLNVYPQNLLKHFMYHYANIEETEYSTTYTQFSPNFLLNISKFIESVPKNEVGSLFKKTSIKVLYLIANFEISEISQADEDEELFNTMRAGLPLSPEYLFLGALQEHAPDRFSELLDSLQNPDYKFFRNLFIEGKAYEERQTAKRGSGDSSEEIVSKLFKE